MNVLVVVAHPDDETLGCGGTIAKHAAAGDTVSVLLPTRRCDPGGVRHWSALLAGFRESCKTLGAKAIVPDDLMAETDAESQPHLVHDAILPWIEQCDFVLTHWKRDVNQVHRGIARAVEIATRPFRRRRNVSCFEVPTSTEQGFGDTPAFAPSEYVVLDEVHVKRKLAALALYKTELVAGRTPDDLERRLRVRGSEIGVTYAEAFVVARRFR